MSYAIVDVELERALPSLVVPDRHAGIAIVVRYRDRPVGFMMKALPAKSVLGGAELAGLIEQELDAGALQDGPPSNEASARARRADLPSVTIAICTKDRPEGVNRCVQALRALPDSVSHRPAKVDILIVDNAPSDGRTRELVARLPGVRYTCEPKPGLDFARNRALEEATGELIVFLDDDVTVDRGWLAGLMCAFAENPDAAGFTGLVLPYELATEAQIMFEQLGGFRAQLQNAFRKKRHGASSSTSALYPCEAAIFGVGANMAFRRELVRALGGFDEALDTGASLPGGGDLDMFYRVIRAGYSLAYEPAYMVFHQHRREIAALRRQYRGWSLGFTAFLAKSYRTDLTQRAKLRWLVGGWFKYQLRHLWESLLGRHPLPPNIVFAGFYGGMLGLLGGYSRSQKRIEHIRRRYESSLDVGPANG